MLPKFFVSIHTVHVDISNDIFEQSLSVIAKTSNLESAFEQTLKYLTKSNQGGHSKEGIERSIQIRESSQIVAMATIKDGEAKWLKSPTVADAINWSAEVSNNLRKIESQGLNAKSDHDEQSIAFKVCANLIQAAKDKLSSLFQPRANDEVYATLKRVEEHLVNRPKENLTNLFEMSR